MGLSAPQRCHRFGWDIDILAVHGDSKASRHKMEATKLLKIVIKVKLVVEGIYSICESLMMVSVLDCVSVVRRPSLNGK